MYSSDAARHYIDLVHKPIRPDDYAGGDIRYTTEYEALELELAKGTSLHEGAQVDWQRILQGSETVLTSLSKDLRVACWLSWALYQTQSFAGLVSGLAMLSHMCSHRWADIHPQKPKTRAAAISWLMARLEKVLDASVPVQDQVEIFQQMVGHLDRLDAVLTVQLTDNAPLILPLRRRVATMIERAVDHSKPVLAPSVVAQVKQAASQWLSGNTPIESEKDALQATRAQRETSLRLCTWWLRQKATDIRALRLNRTVAWLSINSLPQQSPERITEERGVPGERLKDYREQFQRGQYADLLVQLETSIARAPLWLDGQKMVWECLEALGADAARQELEVILALFLKRLPGIAELRFHDGTAFADDLTREWIAVTVMPHIEPSAEALAINDDTPRWDLAFNEQLPRLRKGGLKLAIQELKQGLQSARSARERFFWQFTMARLCHRAKKYELAKAQLEVLDAQLQQSALHLWEPELALQVLRLLRGCHEALPQSSATDERKEEIYRRLCHLDLEVVLE
jgi:type VI secretion system protein VasJ